MKLPKNSVVRSILIILLCGVGTVLFPLTIGFAITLYAFTHIKKLPYRIAVIVLAFFVTLALGTLWTSALYQTAKHTKQAVTTTLEPPTPDDEEGTATSTQPSQRESPVPSSNTVHPSSTGTTPAVSSNGCNQALWSYVYNPSRLKILNQCLQVTGTIEVIRLEKDGDDHILLKLDPGQENLLNEKNIAQQHSDLVLEPVCLHTVTQADAKSSCNGFHSNVAIPRVGTHVKVIGSYVLDTAHGWNEIHPVSTINNL